MRLRPPALHRPRDPAHAPGLRICASLTTSWRPRPGSWRRV